MSYAIKLFAFMQFYRLGFFTLDGKFVGSALDNRPPEDHLLARLPFTWKLSPRAI
jgi:hypothetical protein